MLTTYRVTPYFLAFALVLSLLVSGCGESSRNSGKTLATFGGMKITEDEFNQKASSLPRQLRQVALRNKREFLEDMSNEHYLLKEAERRKINLQKEVKNLIEAARRKILIAKLIDTEIDKKVTLTAEEVRDYYDAHKEDFMTPLLLRAQHILVKTEEEAKVVQAELAAGADFEELARAKSIDGTAIRGGDLGFFQKGQFFPEFEQAVFAMKKGETSGILKTQFGYHIIRLTDRAEPRLRDFKAVRQHVEERIINEKRSTAFKAYVSKLKGNTKMNIDEKALEAVVPAS
jgi:peptidyl-prolyl cis-trans isomerase C